MRHGYLDLHLEADSLVLVKMIKGEHACPWRLQKEFEELLKFKRLFPVISHCYREANKPANWLANFGADFE